MASLPVLYARIQQIVDFLVVEKLNSSQRHTLIFNLLDVDRSRHFQWIEWGDLFLNSVEQDLQILHASLPDNPLIPSPSILLKTGNEHRARFQLHAQSSSVQKVLQEDIASLHGSSFESLPAYWSTGDAEKSTTAREIETVTSRFLSGSPSNEILDARVWYRANETRNESGVATQDNRLFAEAPPLSTTADMTPKSNKRRAVASDWFSPEQTLYSQSMKPTEATHIGIDIERLLKEELAAVLCTETGSSDAADPSSPPQKPPQTVNADPPTDSGNEGSTGRGRASKRAKQTARGGHPLGMSKVNQAQHNRSMNAPKAPGHQLVERRRRGHFPEAHKPALGGDSYRPLYRQAQQRC